MVVPLLVACVAFFRLAIHRLRGDTSVLVHLREGALAGLLGVAVESVWETPLLTPAVFLLAAMAAGLVVHRRRDDEAGA
jgi:hypothetical protein